MSAPLVPLLYVWGDDDLVAERLVRRFGSALGTTLGTPLERWDARAEAGTAGVVVTQLEERLTTSVLFGGGTLAVVTSPRHLVRRNEDRDRVVRAIETMAPGNALAIIYAKADSDRKDIQKHGNAGPRALIKAIGAAGGTIVQAQAPRPTGLGAWITDEARDRGLALGPGAARALADRLGARVTDGDVDRRYLSRTASSELDKLALRHAADGAPVSVEDVESLVAETIPGSIFGLTDAVGDRQPEAALAAIDRLLDTRPEPVILAVLHRRVVELLELGDRLRAGAKLSDAARAMGIGSPFRAEMLAGQARHWTGDELAGALAELVELDASSKGVPGYEADAAQRRLAFVLWVRRWATPRATATTGGRGRQVSDGARSVG